MPFNRILATELARGDDRDIAPFFAGREAEIRAFDNAVANAGRKDQAVFRIFQGPPGCGKTSLAAHLAKTRADRVMFVSCDTLDLADAKALSERIDRAALARGSTAARMGAFIAEAASEHLGLRAVADATRDRLAGHSARSATLALHLDEAQAKAPRAADMLVTLHTTGIGVSCVVVMTGLGHTRSVVSAIPGLSRPARNATVEMGAMTERECADSTQAMLKATAAAGTADDRDEWAALTGELANGWPQHLHCAQVSLCEELLRVDGAMRHVDAERVRERSDAMRHAYYEMCLDHTTFQIDRAVTRQVLVALAKGGVRGKRALTAMCAREFERADAVGWFGEHDVTPLRFAEELAEKGILRETKGQWRAAIPSMAEWAAKHNGVESPPKPREGGGGQPR